MCHIVLQLFGSKVLLRCNAVTTRPVLIVQVPRRMAKTSTSINHKTKQNVHKARKEKKRQLLAALKMSGDLNLKKEICKFDNRKATAKEHRVKTPEAMNGEVSKAKKAKVNNATSVKTPTKKILRALLSKEEASPRIKIQPNKCAIYTRTSSKANVAGSSAVRQVDAALATLASMTKAKVSKQDITTISDCVSGMLPIHRRKRLVDIITSGQYKAVFFESSRALARKASVAENLAALAAEHGVQLIPGDIPTLFTRDSPIDRFVCRVTMAVAEFERDMIYKRMMSGLVEKLRKEEAKPKRLRALTQQGICVLPLGPIASNRSRNPLVQS